MLFDGFSLYSPAIFTFNTIFNFQCKINGQEPHSQALRERFAKSGSEMSTDELDVLMEDFVASAERGDHVKNGWPNSAYRVSKVGVSALSRIQNRQLRDRDASIVVNHVHPGYVSAFPLRGLIKN